MTTLTTRRLQLPVTVSYSTRVQYEYSTLCCCPSQKLYEYLSLPSSLVVENRCVSYCSVGLSFRTTAEQLHVLPVQVLYSYRCTPKTIYRPNKKSSVCYVQTTVCISRLARRQCRLTTHSFHFTLIMTTSYIIINRLTCYAASVAFSCMYSCVLLTFPAHSPNRPAKSAICSFDKVRGKTQVICTVPST